MRRLIDLLPLNNRAGIPEIETADPAERVVERRDDAAEVGRAGEPLLYGEIAPGFGNCASAISSS